MFIVTPEKRDQPSYIAAEVYQAGTNTPAFDRFSNAKFITVMSEKHTVLSTWKKMFGNFLPQMTKGDLDVFKRLLSRWLGVHVHRLSVDLQRRRNNRAGAEKSDVLD